MIVPPATFTATNSPCRPLNLCTAPAISSFAPPVSRDLNVKFSWNYFLFYDIRLFKLEEGILPKHAGAYKSEKRRKELSRQKKQEERRGRRFQKTDGTPSDTETVEQEETKPAKP